MRDIKFRGKRIDGKGWVYGYLVENENDIYRAFIVTSARWDIDENGCTDLLETELYEVIPETIGQYTGLHDKNDKKIYEGDISKVKGFNYPQKVVFEDKSCCFSIISSESDDVYYGIYEDKGKRPCEIIGNIYDNPELLREE